MHPWIFLRGGPQSIPDAVAALAADLTLCLPAMAATETPNGGLHRIDLLGALASAIRGHGLGVPDGGTFALREIDLVGWKPRVAVTVQTGRARTNNGALLAVLAAASLPDVRWLIAIVPERYKGSMTARPVHEDLRHLSRSQGVSLDLSGILVLSF